MINRRKLPTVFLGIFFALLVLFVANIDFTGKDVFDTIFKEINGVLATFLFYDIMEVERMCHDYTNKKTQPTNCKSK